MRDILNCPNCGAPIEKDYCSYCGSVFLDWACFDVRKPTFVKVKDRTGKINLMKLRLNYIEENDPIETCTLADNQRYFTIRSKNVIDFEASFTAVPFTHYLAPDKKILQLQIDPEVVDPDILKDIEK